MLVDDFDFDLPDELIARYPASERRGSRLLQVAGGSELVDGNFSELPSLLRAGDLLVLNDTRVIPARVHGYKTTGGAIEIMIERVEAANSAIAQLRSSKTAKPGTKITLPGNMTATVAGRQGDLFRLDFSGNVRDFLHEHGSMPLPPYLRREAESVDSDRYQTVYAARDGAVAAPTAGLHFDQHLLDELASAGIRTCFVTLHVGAGTFQSLRKEVVEENRLHAERVTVSEQVCAAVSETRAAGARVVAVGTTSVRALEAASAGGSLQTMDGESDLFIYPGYRFHSVDLMLTNFHLPRSSLIMLVAAFAGTGRILAAYRHAVAMRYRFFSYGDSMLVTPNQDAHGL